ncbi:MAG: 2-oxoglutarate dehydrogenase complex dihydrolipoyllysine-residue succinyltransferase [Deltaproteobacteria bacterium]
MPVELKVPSVGESVFEVEIGDWLKSVGDSVNQDDIIVMLETDKVTVELPAPVNGTISKILFQKGASAKVGDILGYMEEGAAVAKSGAAPRSAPLDPAFDRSQGSDAPPATIPPASTPRVMPAAQRALHAAGLEAAEVQPSGPGGRTLKEDVQRHVAGRPAEAPQKPELHEPRSKERKPPPAPNLPASGARQEEIVPMTSLRRRVAERLVEAQHSAALLTTFNEVDMSAVKQLREAYQEAFLKKYSIKLGFMSFFVKAAVDALKQFPSVNAEVRGTDIVYHNYFDIGVAVGGGKGLVVPVLRNVERMGFAEVEQTISKLAGRAKDGSLKLDELQGGTFTITNGGIYGSLLSTPIVNPPQSGILGLHGINDRAVVIKGEIVARPMMYIALTYDHRIVDGREAVGFLKRIKDAIEEPTRMLIEV